MLRSLEANNVPYPFGKYSTLGYLNAFGNGMGFGEMFSYNRMWYPVLKCFIYGREDNRISEEYLNEAAIYYCHKRKFEESYEAKIQDILKEGYGLKVDNVQERFIFNIEKGKHSIHVQNRFLPVLAKIVDEYLSVIEQL
jgi:hypothetical protein